jgi:hypothetical protein
MSYEEVYTDWKYLWDIAPVNDMTGGYVDQEDLKRMLKSPSKKTAVYCLKRQMEYWFHAGPDGYECGRDYEQLCQDYSKLEYIRTKYDFNLGDWL